MEINLKRRSMADMPQAIVDAWQSAFSIEIPEKQKEILVFQVQVLCLQAEKAEREECAKLADDGYRCRNCKEFFLSSTGHDCGNPDWESLTPTDIASAIRNRSSAAPPPPKADDSQPDCLCGHPYHVGGCSAIVAGDEYNYSCTCDEYEADDRP